MTAHTLVVCDVCGKEVRDSRFFAPSESERQLVLKKGWQLVIYETGHIDKDDGEPAYTTIREMYCPDCHQSPFSNP